MPAASRLRSRVVEMRRSPATLLSVTTIASGCAQHGRSSAPRPPQQPAADHDVVAARAEVDGEPLRLRSRRRSVGAARRRAASDPLDDRLIGTSLLSTMRSASRVDRGALREQLGELAPWIAAREQRTLARPARCA